MRVCQFRHFGSLQPGELRQLRELLVSQSQLLVSIVALSFCSATLPSKPTESSSCLKDSLSLWG
jgi:hypothetical protein